MHRRGALVWMSKPGRMPLAATRSRPPLRRLGQRTGERWPRPASDCLRQGLREGPQQQPFCFFVEESFFLLLAFLLGFLAAVVAGVVALAGGRAGSTGATTGTGSTGVSTVVAGIVEAGAAGTNALALSTKVYWYWDCEKGWNWLALGAPMGKIVLSWSCEKGWACW
mmetsp:Transcript_81219/g.256173  ORF Transcript_81219/g.256173 Transcript_81219/m.256173 type:complete len:167 (-) Transcript_81219:407-907(-)